VVKLNFATEAIDSPPASINVLDHSMPPSDFLQSFEVPWLATILAAVQAIGPNTYVHCEHGQDRTGLVVAAYRVLHDGWTTDAARAEALSYGYHVELPGLDIAWEHFVDYAVNGK
jgi:protein tyrosine/serine phosphatase